MRSAKELVGKPIYSLTNGRFIGTVRDLYVDGVLHSIAGIYLGSEGLINRRARLIPRDKVATFGEDVILVIDSNVVSDDRDYDYSQDWLRRDSLAGRIMYTSGGTKVASLGDLMIDDEAQIAALSLARVYVEGPIADNRLVTREAVLDTGGPDGSMTIDLSLVEMTSLGLFDSPDVADEEPEAQGVGESEAPESGDMDGEPE